MKRRIFFIVVLAIVLGGFAWYVLRSREPRYEGKSLTYWLEQYNETAMVQHGKEEECAQAKHAVHQIGTNANPTLLRMLRAKDSRLMIKLETLVGQQRFVKSPFVSADQKHDLANTGFGILGAEAKDAVPGLISIYRENISEDLRTTAANALRLIGPAAKEAVPALLESLARPNLSMEADGNTIDALGEIHSHPELVVPALLKCLNDSNQNIRWLAMGSIASFGADARMAVPALLAEATNPASRSRGPAIQALGRIRCEPETFLPVLRRGLKDPNPQIRVAAAEALGDFGPDAKPAIPDLLAALHDDSTEFREVTATALRKIDPEAAAKAGVK
jgi:HEAT repeats